MLVYQNEKPVLFNVTDDSMAPLAHPGDQIQLDSEAPIEEGSHVVVIMNGQPLFRRIYQTGGGYKLVAENSEYPPYSMRMRPEIVGVASRIYIPIKNILEKEYKRYDSTGEGR